MALPRCSSSFSSGSGSENVEPDVCQALYSSRRKQRLLECREIVEHSRRRFDGDLGVRDQRRTSLFLERRKARVVLIPALPVRTIGVLAHDGKTRRWWPDRQGVVWSGDGDVKDWHDGAPKVDRGLV